MGGFSSGATGSMSDWGYYEKLNTNLAQRRDDIGQVEYATGQKDVSAGQTNVGKSTDYWSKLLSGDKKELASAIEPERSTIGKAFDAGRKSISEFGGRGGGTSAAVAESKFQEAGEIGKLVSGKKEAAAGELAKTGLAQSEIGMQEANLGLDQMTKAEAQLGDIFNTLITQQVKYETGKKTTDWGGIAQGIGEALGMLLFP